MWAALGLSQSPAQQSSRESVEIQLRKVLVFFGCGNLAPMSATDLEFRWTLGLSLMMHAMLLGAIGFTGLMRTPLTRAEPLRPDVWVGTTVTVVETPRKDSVPTQPESAGQQSALQANGSQPRASAMAAPAAANTRKIRVQTSVSGRDQTVRQQEHEPGKRAQSAPTPALGVGGAGVDLKQAMQNSLNSPTSAAGSFGAAGVDLTERRLPKAFTRALPVAIGAEPLWWKQRPGLLGSIRFKVALSETGKIELVTFEDEDSRPFHARVVRRVAKLLALGTFALPNSSAGGVEQEFELRLVMEQRQPETDSNADPGDLVEKGFEAPTVDKPGQAIIRDAQGHTMHASLKLLPSRG